MQRIFLFGSALRGLAELKVRLRFCKFSCFSIASAKVRRFLESAKCFVGKFDFVVVFLSKMTFFQEVNLSMKAKAEAPFEFASAFVLFFSRGA